MERSERRHRTQVSIERRLSIAKQTAKGAPVKADTPQGPLKKQRAGAAGRPKQFSKQELSFKGIQALESVHENFHDIERPYYEHSAESHFRADRG